LTQFTDFALGESILRAIADEGHTTPTPIQQKSIAPILAGRDLCGIAQTGTGKTAAFALPILERLSHTRANRVPGRPRVLVLTPTRELASQVAQSFVTYGASLKLSVTTIFGGVSQGPQVTALKRGVDILVATPGRLLDLIEQRHLTLGGVEILVVDEADQMLDLGFIVPLRKIVKMVPAKRQTLFFSATMPKTIAELADSMLTDPVQVAVAPVASTVDLVEQSVMFISQGEKQRLLERVLADPKMWKVLVFTRTKHGADKVVKSLVRARIEAAAIHGNKSQAQRERALAAFKNGGTRVLVATDIAARGIHVEGVTHVVNFELPNIPESYVHRIGRTARAGAAGVAISFCNGEERAFLRDIEKLTRMSVPVAALPEGISAGVETDPAEKRPARRGRNQTRRNEQPRGEKHAQGKPAQKHRRGQKHSGEHHGNRSHANGHGNRPQGNPRRERHEGGLDAATGLPAFLTRPQQRRGNDRRAEA
jgi:ATP-dependent RNA helicase RhlE